MWGISGVCTLALFDLAWQDGNISSPKCPRGTRGNGNISEARFILCIIPTLLVLLFFNSRILQTGILQTGPNQFVENQKRPVPDQKVQPVSFRPEKFDLFTATLQTGILQTGPNQFVQYQFAESSM